MELQPQTNDPAGLPAQRPEPAVEAAPQAPPPVPQSSPEDEPLTRHIFGTAVLFEAGLGLVALAIGWAVSFSAAATLAFTPESVAWGVLATAPLLLCLVLMNRYPIGPLADLKRLVDELIVPLFRDLRWWQLAVISLAAGFGEELLFRGLLQAGFGAWLARRLAPSAASGVALVVASLLFGLMHPISKLYAALCILIGLYLGALWMVTGNLLGPIVTHGLYDFAALLYLLRKGAARS